MVEQDKLIFQPITHLCNKQIFLVPKTKKDKFRTLSSKILCNFATNN